MKSLQRLFGILAVTAGAAAHAQIETPSIETGTLFQQSENFSSDSSSALESDALSILRWRRPPGTGSYYNWGRAQNGWGYCYQWTMDGHVLNGGNPVDNFYCEQRHPSYANWGRAQNGWGYCYQYAPQGYVLNQGQPIPNMSCERTSPSFYRWGQSVNGMTYCYQYTPNGYVLNQGQPVPNYYCQY